MSTKTLALLVPIAVALSTPLLAQPAPQPPSQPCPAVRDVLLTNGRIHTMDVGNTIVRFDWFSLRPLPDFATDERWCELTRLSEEVQAEDAGICEIVQQNIGSRAYLPGPYSPQRECGVHLFHTLMNAWG